MLKITYAMHTKQKWDYGSTKKKWRNVSDVSGECCSHEGGAS